MKWESWQKAARLAQLKAEYRAAVEVLAAQSPSDQLRDRCEHTRVAGRHIPTGNCGFSAVPFSWVLACSTIRMLALPLSLYLLWTCLLLWVVSYQWLLGVRPHDLLYLVCMSFTGCCLCFLVTILILG